MWRMIWPILIVIVSSSLYNVTAKSTAPQANAFASLSLVYLISAAVCLLLFFITGKEHHLFAEYSKLNWASYIMGLAIVGIELGYISVYRAGWRLNAAPLVVNIVVASVLLFVGLLFYKQPITLRQVAGMVVCAGGLFLLMKP